ncbi:MAG: hypothetical protein IT176_07025 [Acidobacteria bacterium]|nr:hypothetical protein [Acidobacteriota bacterium]
MTRTAAGLALSVGLAAALAVVGCGGEQVAPGAITAETAPANTPAMMPEGAMGHGTHDPKHGGVVLMSDAYHFEVVAKPSGAYEIYFTDMARNDLPATIAKTVTLTIKRPAGAPPETIPLKVNDTGEAWVGSGKPVDDLQNTLVGVEYLGKTAEKPYQMDVPFYATQPGATAPGATPAPGAPPPALARP